MKNSKMKNRYSKKNEIIQLLYIIIALVVLFALSSKFYFRWDLTSDKRYTLSTVTKDFMRSLDNDVYVKVYLKGDLNVGFERLSKATFEMLSEVKQYSKKEFYFEAIDLSKNPEYLEDLDAFGLDYIPVFETKSDGRKIQTKVYPYAILASGDAEVAITLLENIPGKSGAENLNISVENLEFKIVDAVRKLIIDDTPKVAFLEGHGELDEWDVYETTHELSNYFQVDRGSIDTNPYILDDYDAVIIAKPTKPFSEKDKFILDQYLMRGGSLFWLVDAVNITTDSLQVSSHTVGLAQELNIADMLFRYGVRINPEVVQDMQAAYVPINVADVGEQPQIVPMPWMFHPLLNTNLNHPITRNLNVVRAEFASSIDTVGANVNLHKDILLQTGRYSRRMPTPIYVSMAMINEQPTPEAFNYSRVPVAVAVEGVFQSLYTNRPIPPGVDFNPADLKRESENTKIVVVADGDIIKNEVRFRHSSQPQIGRLGYDEFSGQTFGNKQFVINAINYLSDDKGWMALRNREHTLRLINREMLTESKLAKWRWLNIATPLAILLLIGLWIPIWRRMKYR